MRIDPKQTAALVIDFQERLIPVMHHKEALMEHADILLTGLQELGIPTYLTQQYTKGLGMTAKEIQEACKTETYTEKIRFSAYEEVEPLIHEKKYILVCGIEAHICVLQTIIDLAANGYIPILVVDCISSRKESDLAIALKRAVEEGAFLTTYEAVLFELLQEAGTLQSKKIQRLIK
ncbi:MAG: isochorismatase family protein [Hungatella sp.]